MWGNLESDHAHPGKGTGSEKTWEDPKFTPQDDGREAVYNNFFKKWKQQQTANLRVERESNLQSHHIIKLKYPVFTNNNNKKPHKN